jgi:DNA-binding response OmpR family regulator
MKVLLVEDESKVANFVSRGLEEEGYGVDVAGDAGRALNLSPRGITTSFFLIS